MIIDLNVKLIFEKKINEIKRNIIKAVSKEKNENKKINQDLLFICEEDEYRYRQNKEARKELEAELEVENEDGTVTELVLSVEEDNKNRKTKELIENILLKNRFDKDLIVFSVGGGVLGDLCGFVCATFYRGIRYVQIPTTLISMLDSSIGGKTAINTTSGKNLIGAYKHPIAVFIDYEFLFSLSNRHLSNGLAEAVKIGITSGLHIFELCELLANKGLNNMNILKEIIYLCVECKNKIVMSDEKCLSSRNILNFGHTIGHAIEILPNNSLFHGECVSIGCVYELLASRAMGFTCDNTVQRAENCFRSLHLPTSLSDIFRDNYNMNTSNDSEDASIFAGPEKSVINLTQRIFENMTFDKKNRNGFKYIVVVKRIGIVDSEVMKPVPDALLLRLLSPSISVTFNNLKNNKEKKENEKKTKEEHFDIPCPLGVVSGFAKLPGSKAITNRALLLCAMGEGTCEIRNLTRCEDVNAMINALSMKLNFSIQFVNGKEIRSSSDEEKKSHSEEFLIFHGMGLCGMTEEQDTGEITPDKSSINNEKKQNYARNDKKNYQSSRLDIWVENSGTLCRFICPFLAVLMMKRDYESRKSKGENSDFEGKEDKKTESMMRGIQEIRLDGNVHMKNRPIKHLIEAMQRAFPLLNVQYEKSSGYLPLVFTLKTHTATYPRKTLTWEDYFPGGEILINNKLSSQFVTALLLVCPFAAKTTQLTLKGNEEATSLGCSIPSEPYIEMTVKMMKLWGAQVQRIAANKFIVLNGRYINPSVYTVEGDSTAASYLLAFAAITGGDVTVDMTHPKISLQGDSKFINLLEDMGCVVYAQENENCVRVVGPKDGKLKSVKKDFNEITDSFMTAAVLMSRAANVSACKGEFNDFSEITNIANQRVKECNRISAMYFNLLKVGIRVEELADGLRIYPSLPYKHSSSFQMNRSPEKVVISCFHDHRIAMSFAVFSTIRPNIHIPQWRCVEKTFPTFWDICERNLNLTIKESFYHNEDSFFDISRPPIVLIGMRNSLKSTLSRMYGKEKNMYVVDIDEEICKDFNERNRWKHAIELNEGNVDHNINEIVQELGWSEFRSRETQTLLKFLGLNSNREALQNFIAHRNIDSTPHTNSNAEHVPFEERHIIISCGGGIIENKQATLILKNFPFVVWLKLNEDDVLQFCLNEKVKTSYNDSVHDVYKRRKSLYYETSKCEFDAPSLKELKMNGFLQDDSHKFSEEYVNLIYTSFERFLSSVIFPSPLLLENSVFLCLTLSNYSDLSPNTIKELDHVFRQVDAVEVRVDLLTDINSISKQLFYLRQMKSIPQIILTCRSRKEGGKFEGVFERYIDICTMLMRSGVEYVDLEIYGNLCGVETSDECSPHCGPEAKCAREKLNKLLKFSYSEGSVRMLNTKIISSFHSYCRERRRGLLSSDTIERCMSRMCFSRLSLGVDILKIVYECWYDSSNDRVNLTNENVKIVSIANETSQRCRKPLIALLGGNEGVLSRVLNRFFTPVTHELLIPAAPGQLRVDQLKHIRSTLNFTEKYFYVVGHPVCYSASPAMHNSAFKIRNCFPRYKFTLYDTLHESHIPSLIRSSHFGGTSVTIPFKNVVHKFVDFVDQHATLIGAINTIYKDRNERICGTNTDFLAIIKAIQKYHSHTKGKNVLVIGAGGAARAACYAVKMLDMNLYVYNRTKEKAKNLCRLFEGSVYDYNTEEESNNFAAIISALPGYHQLKLPEQIFASKPLIIEFAYHPPITQLIKYARSFHCNEVLGIDILIWQGLEQNKLFTNQGNFTEEEQLVITNEVYTFYKKMFQIELKLHDTRTL